MPQKNSAKFAFFYMLSLVALIFMAVSTGMIIFQIINKHFVDIINQWRGRYEVEALKFAISALIISTPIYYLCTKQIHKNLFSGELDKDAGVRRWLTYFILFVASVVMLGWLIGVINGFLDGELTGKFILKALTALGISAIIFTFYLHDIKREEVIGKKDKVTRIYFYGSLALVIIVFAASLFFVESPKETRNRKLDQRVVNSFYDINSAINQYYASFGKLPADLDELKKENNYLSNKATKDPQTGKEYDYKIIDETKFELCATFRTSNKDDQETKFRYGPLSDYNYHDAGYRCLSNKVEQPTALQMAKPLPVGLLQ